MIIVGSDLPEPESVLAFRKPARNSRGEFEAKIGGFKKNTWGNLAIEYSKNMLIL
jgi:hypothetical protein